MPRSFLSASGGRPPPQQRNYRRTSAPSSSLPKKKITIKPFRQPPKLPDDFYETTSSQLLQQATQVILLETQKTSSSSSSTRSTPKTPSSSLSLQNSYSSVVDLVSHQYGPRLYQDLKCSMKEAANVVLDKDEIALIRAAAPSSGSSILQHVQTKYQLYVDYVLLCRHVFLPLDQTHVWVSDDKVLKRSSSVVATTAAAASNNNTSSHQNKSGSSFLLQSSSSSGTTTTHNKTLWDVGLAQFRDRLIELSLDVTLQEQFWEALWEDYKGQQQQVDDRFLLAKTIQMWQDLSMLTDILQNYLQPQLETHLSRESQQWKSAEQDSYDPTRFLPHVEQQWRHVSQKWTFLPRTWLRTLVEVKLLRPHLNTTYLLHPTHFSKMLEQDSLSLIQTLWMLAGRLHHGWKDVTAAICAYGRTKGLSLVHSATTTASNASLLSSSSFSQNKKVMIAGLLQLHSLLNTKLQEKLGNPVDLQLSLKHVWDDVLNENQNVVAEHLAKHVDLQFRSTKSLSSSASNKDTNLEDFSKNVLALFIHLQAKDVFEAFYKRDLAKRLLLSKVVSMDIERSMVTLLKAECGAGYTSKMEGMFQDVEWSREAMARYKAQQPQQDNTTLTMTTSTGEPVVAVDMEVQVLTTGYWPVYPQHANLILPPSLKIPQERFWNHYKTKYQGRRMTWQYALGNCVVRANFEKKWYDLVVSLCQALVLLCFNTTTDGGWTLPDVMKQTGIEDRAEVERLLQSLSLGKEGTRVLRKMDYCGDDDDNDEATLLSKKSRKIRQSVHDKDTFVVNKGFESHLRRIRINNIQFKETRQERDKTIEGVSRDRLYLMDAVLVRIMKARKTILHQQLLPQVLEQVKVPAQPSDVKKRIESLIEREYMERDKKDHNRYNYLA